MSHETDKVNSLIGLLLMYACIITTQKTLIRPLYKDPSSNPQDLHTKQGMGCASVTPELWRNRDRNFSGAC